MTQLMIGHYRSPAYFAMLRSISLRPNLARYFNNHQILYELQHGFRDQRSSETQLIQLVEDLSKQLIQGKQIDLVLLEFIKAFDKVSYFKLLFKLSQHGNRGDTLTRIKSLLRTLGVPQGSILGPLLFVPYINDLSHDTQSQVRLFAVGTAVYLTVRNNSGSDILQADLDRLKIWERTRDIEFNPSKCQVLHIRKSRHSVSTQYSLHNQALESVDGAKYLGVYLSKDLSWNTHVNNITSTAYKTLGFVKRNVSTTHLSVRELAYKTPVNPQVHPRLEYASNVWSLSTKANIYNKSCRRTA